MNNWFGEVICYQTSDGETRTEVRLEQDTVWLSQEQMAALFDVQKAGISKHLKNIYSSGERERTATVSKMETVQQGGTRRVTRQIEHFNLDAVISVGYRVNSTWATRLRRWATRVIAGTSQPWLHAEPTAFRSHRPRAGSGAATGAQGGMDMLAGAAQ